MNYCENPGASESEIAQSVCELSKVIGKGAIPQVLLEQWRRRNGFQGDTVVFYSTTEIVDRNEVFEVGIFCPGFVAIANDGGSMVALLEATEGASEVLINFMGSMTPSSMKKTNQDLDEWIQKGCIFEGEIDSEFDAAEKVRLQLEKIPDDGIKGLMRINNTLNLGLSIVALKQMEKQLPVVLCKMWFIRTLRAIQELKAASVVSIWSEERPDCQLPVENPFD